MAGDRPSARNPNLCTNSRVNQGRQLTESQHEQQLVQIEWGISLSPSEVVEECNISGMVECFLLPDVVVLRGHGPCSLQWISKPVSKSCLGYVRVRELDRGMYLLSRNDTTRLKEMQSTGELGV